MKIRTTRDGTYYIIIKFANLIIIHYIIKTIIIDYKFNNNFKNPHKYKNISVRNISENTKPRPVPVSVIFILKRGQQLEDTLMTNEQNTNNLSLPTYSLASPSHWSKTLHPFLFFTLKLCPIRICALKFIQFSFNPQKIYMKTF